VSGVGVALGRLLAADCWSSPSVLGSMVQPAASTSAALRTQTARTRSKRNSDLSMLGS
jgi:hypothetical protein